MKNIVIIKTDLLKETFENVRNAISRQENRPVFTGVLLEVEKDILTMTTCDGFKLFTSSASAEIIDGGEFKVVVPAFDIPKNAGTVTRIEVDKDIISYDFENTKHTYKLIEGDFIEYKSLLNRKDSFTINFNTKLLKEALRNIKGIVELSFVGDRDAMIIKSLENESNKKYVLPYAKLTN